MAWCKCYVSKMCDFTRFWHMFSCNFTHFWHLTVNFGVSGRVGVVIVFLGGFCFGGVAVGWVL